MTSPRPCMRDAGFTLLELLVVMSMLSLVMLGLGSGMRTMVKADAGIDGRMTVLDELRVARQFVVQIVGKVSAQRVQRPEGEVLLFQAQPDSLSWIGVMPARPGVGGMHQLRLAIEPDESNQPSLVLRYHPWDAGAGVVDWTQARQRVLLKGAVELVVEAEGLPPKSRQNPVPWPQGWQKGWAVPDRLPDRIRIGFRDALGQTQQWTVPVHVTAQTDDSLTTVTVGGAAR